MALRNTTPLPHPLPAALTPMAAMGAGPGAPTFHVSTRRQVDTVVLDPGLRQKHFEVLAAIRSNVNESSIDAAIKARLGWLLDELDAHLGVATFHAKRAALSRFADDHGAVLFPVVGPLIETLADHP
ncbi:MAG: hypothetical protein QM617_09485 [Comamonas sp.]